MFHPCILQYLDAGQIPEYGDDVRRHAQSRKPFFINVNDSDVIGLVAEHLCQMGTYFSRTFDDDYHGLNYF